MDNEADFKSFCDEILAQFFEGYNEIDMCDIQSIALDHKILKRVTVNEPCGDDCSCAEYIGIDEFPLSCFRKNYEPDVPQVKRTGGVIWES